MKILLFFLLFTLASSEQLLEDSDKYRALCYIYGKYSFFDLRSLEKAEQDYLLLRTTYSDEAETIVDAEYVYGFNFCQPARNSCTRDGKSVVEEQQVWAYHLAEMSNGETECVEYSGRNLMSSMESQVLWNHTTGEKHIQIQYLGGDKCPGRDDKYSYTIEVKCNPQAIDPIPFGIIVEDECHPRLLYESAAGCPVLSLTSWAVFLGEHPLLAAIILIVVGIFTCFFGKKFFDVVVGVMGLLLGFALSMLFFSALGMVDYLDPFDSDGSLLVTVLAFVLSLAVGIIAGAVLYNFAIVIGLYFLSVLVGLFLGIVAYNTFLNTTDNLWLLLLCSVVGAIVLLVLAVKFDEFILILSTSFLGAYACVRGVSMIFGGYPSELEMYQAVSNGIEMKFEYTFYLYLLVIALMFVAGLCWQRKEGGDGEDGYKKLEG